MADDVTNIDRATTLAMLSNARDALAVSFQIVTQIAATLGGVPRVAIEAYNAQADALTAFENKLVQQMRSTVAQIPNGQTLLQFLPSQSTPVPHIVLPPQAVLGAVSKAASEKMVAELVELALERRAAAKVGRPIPWLGLSIGAAGVGATLLGISWITKGDRADAELVETQAVIVTRALALYDKTAQSCVKGGGDQATCLALANKAFSDFLATAKQGLPSTSPGLINTIGWIVAGGVTILVGYRVFVRYRNRQWPFESAGTTPRRSLPSYNDAPDDAADGDFEEDAA